MKKFLKYFLGLGALATVVLATGCEDGGQVVDDIVSQEQRGAILRTVSLNSNELPIGNADGNFSVDLEVQDKENGNLVQDVEVYVGFRDNTEDVGPGTDVDDVLVETINNSTFIVGEFGLPRFSYSITLPELLSIVGRSEADITGGDQFTIRFELVLVDGRRFSFADNSGTITGSFFSSPFLYTPNVTCAVPSEAFVGMYLIEQITPELGGSPTLSSGTIVELSVGATSVERVFLTEQYPVFCGGSFNEFKFDLICGRVSVPTQNGRCVCDDGADWYTQPEVQETYDLNDDSSFLLTFTDDTQSDCDVPAQTTYRFTKS